MDGLRRIGRVGRCTVGAHQRGGALVLVIGLVEGNSDGTEPLGRCMADPLVLVDVVSGDLDPDALRRRLDIVGCGAVSSFIGLTRGEEDGVEVERLEFDAWEERLPSVLEALAERALESSGAHAVAISHRVGAVMPCDPIVAIHVAATHRAEAFEACSWLIDALKAEAPLWKKEVRSDGEIWKGGLG